MRHFIHLCSNILSQFSHFLWWMVYAIENVSILIFKFLSKWLIPARIDFVCYRTYIVSWALDWTNLSSIFYAWNILFNRNAFLLLKFARSSSISLFEFFVDGFHINLHCCRLLKACRISVKICNLFEQESFSIVNHTQKMGATLQNCDCCR